MQPSIGKCTLFVFTTLLAVLGTACTTADVGCDPALNSACVCADAAGNACSASAPGCICALESSNGTSMGTTDNGTSGTGNGTTGETTGNTTGGTTGNTTSNTTGGTTGTMTGGEGQPCTAEGTCDEDLVCGEGNVCVAPCDGVVCPDGQSCVAGACVDPCEGVVCPGEQVCEAGMCVDPCGEVTCGPNEVCEGGPEGTMCMCAEGYDDRDGDGVCDVSAWPADVIVIDIDDQGVGEATARFEDAMERDLGEWGSSDGVRCWGSISEQFWGGRPLYLALSEPVGPWQTITVTVEPEDGVEAEVFAYLQPADRFLVPDAEGVGECKTSFSQTSAGNPGEVETVVFETFSAPPQNLFIGVANETSGSVVVRVEVTDRPGEQCYGAMSPPSFWPAHVHALTLRHQRHHLGRDGPGGAGGRCADV
ncbi:MAG: hypothetical protein AAFX99_03435 [Myxococcota bacterium]